jgi:DNA-binding IscR family transcriptional regulator
MRVDGCVTHLLWKALGENIEAFLDKMTLKDLLKGNPMVEVYQKKSHRTRAVKCRKDAAGAGRTE